VARILAAGLALGATVRRRSRLYLQRLLPAAVLVVMSLGLPVERNPPDATIHAFMLIGCLAWGAMAVLDHRALVRAFERAGPEA
jgi:hypothetical protein